VVNVVKCVVDSETADARFDAGLLSVSEAVAVATVAATAAASTPVGDATSAVSVDTFPATPTTQTNKYSFAVVQG